MTRQRLTLLAGSLLLALGAGALAQQAPPPSTAPSPAVTNPLSTTTSPNPPRDPDKSSAPAADKAVTAPAPAQGAAPGAVPGAAPREALVAKPGEAGDVDEVTLPAKPAAVVSGKSKWEEAVPTLRDAFARIEKRLREDGIAATGRPLAVFTATDDDGFQYDAMIPVRAVPEGKAADGKPADGKPAAEMRFGTTPSGRSMRFLHRGSYDAIDGAYETLTAYLEVKGIAVQDRIVEEYLTDLADKADDQLDVNIYVLLK